MRASHVDFVDTVVTSLDLVVTSDHEHACRLEPRQSDLAWYCDLDDGTPTGDSDPAAFVRWVCPALRTGGATPGAAVPALDVRRAGPQSDLGRMVRAFGRLAGRGSGGAAAAGGDGRYVYTDPAGILDPAMRRRIESWPSARHGDGIVRPAELWSVKRTGEGLVVESVSWWGSAPALEHQIRLAVDIAGRAYQA